MKKMVFIFFLIFCLWSCGINDNEPVISEIATRTFTDSRDSHEYKWIKIGEQVWMAENLAYLPEVTDGKEGSLEFPNYYVYDYYGTDVNAAKAAYNYSTYGVLYNWQAARASCPEGWHLPADAEWKELEMELGMTEKEANECVPPYYRGTDQGYRLKNNRGWNNDGNGNNISGFSGSPGGLRFCNGNFGHIESFGYWWTSTDGLNSGAWCRGLGYNNNYVIRNSFSKENGFCVRCVKDKP